MTDVSYAAAAVYVAYAVDAMLMRYAACVDAAAMLIC